MTHVDAALQGAGSHGSRPAAAGPSRAGARHAPARQERTVTGRPWSRRGALLVVAALAFLPAASFGQTPGEIQNVQVQADGSLSWDTTPAADSYNVYRSVGTTVGDFAELDCTGYALPTGSYAPEDPLPGETHVFVVTGESGAGEGTPGTRSTGLTRFLRTACTPLMRHHVMTRVGYGWSEWSRDRVEALGSLQAFIDEQLDPASIDESTNSVMISKLSLLDPPSDIIDLIGRQVIYGVYARRQLEHKMAMFWSNHFNTEWLKATEYFGELFPDCAVASGDPACDPTFPIKAYRETSVAQNDDFETFRDLAFNGNFRDMLEAGTLSVPMFIYLDLKDSDENSPNENQPREFLELHSMGVDGGYTQQDVEELSRLMTGWGVCKKETADLDDPLAPCIADYWLASPPGAFTANFDITRHDCGPKTLFAGTVQEISFPGTPTCSTAADASAALAEFDEMLDAVVAHPATARFISKKILQLLVTDTPSDAMIDQLVTEWENPGNPHGVGDLREVTRAALSLSSFVDPATASGKIKTPFELAINGFRTLDGKTDGVTGIVTFLFESHHVPFGNETPTGYAETGGDWLNTGGILARQNWGFDLALALVTPNFAIEPHVPANNAGVNLASANETVDFYADILFGGDLTRVERQRAKTYYTSPSLGGSPLREFIGYMMGLPQFQEQ